MEKIKVLKSLIDGVPEHDEYTIEEWEAKKKHEAEENEKILNEIYEKYPFARKCVETIEGFIATKNISGDYAPYYIFDVRHIKHNNILMLSVHSKNYKKKDGFMAIFSLEKELFVVNPFRMKDEKRLMNVGYDLLCIPGYDPFFFVMKDIQMLINYMERTMNN